MMSPKGIFAEQPPGVAPTSIKRLARIAGVFYLIVGITGGFSEGFVDPSMYVAGDATATTGNLVANSGLVRLAVIAHLTDAVFFVLTAVTLYVLLKHVGKHAGRLMVLPVVVAAAIISVSTVFTFAALQVATNGSYVAAFGEVEANALVLLLLEIEHYGILAAQVFFGLWLAPLGYLAYRSGLFPKSLGIILIVATASYLTDVVVAFLLPDLAAQIHIFLGIVPATAEIWMVLDLLIAGVRSAARPGNGAPPTASTSAAAGASAPNCRTPTTRRTDPAKRDCGSVGRHVEGRSAVGRGVQSLRTTGYAGLRVSRPDSVSPANVL